MNTVMDIVGSAGPGEYSRGQRWTFLGDREHNYVRAEDIQFEQDKLLSKYLDQMHNFIVERDRLTCCQYVAGVITFAANFMQTFLAIHAYSDGNGRTSRLVVASILHLIAPFLIPVYNPHNIADSLYDYLDAVSKGQKSFEVVGDPSDLITLILHSVLESWKVFNQLIAT